LSFAPQLGNRFVPRVRQESSHSRGIVVLSGDKRSQPPRRTDARMDVNYIRGVSRGRAKERIRLAGAFTRINDNSSRTMMSPRIACEQRDDLLPADPLITLITLLTLVVIQISSRSNATNYGRLIRHGTNGARCMRHA